MRCPLRHPRIALLVVLSGLSLAAAPAGAQESAGPWRLDEALGAPGWLEIGGSFRLRYVGVDGQFRAGRGGGDQVLESRTLLLARARLGAFELTFEGIDARQGLADGGSALSTSVVDAADVLQASLSWELSDVLVEGGRTRITVGRFTRDLGSRRLMARNRYRNTINAFQGVEGEWQAPDGQTLRAFYTAPVRRRPADIPSLLDNRAQLDDAVPGARFWGVAYAYSSLIYRLSGEIALLRLTEDDAAGTRANALWTPTIRLHREPRAGGLDFELEVARQIGERRGGDPGPVRDVSAWMWHVEVGRTFAGAWSPRVSALYDRASGDDPDDDRYGRFDALFGATRGDFGPTGIHGPFRRANLRSAGLRVELRPRDGLDLTLIHRGFWLASAQDAWVGAGRVDPTGSSGDDLGRQTELRLRWQLLPDSVRLDGGGAWLRMGDFGRRTGAPERSLVGYLASTWSF